MFIYKCIQIITIGYTKYSYEFLGTFDTVIQIIGYAEDSDEFEAMAKIAGNVFRV